MMLAENIDQTSKSLAANYLDYAVLFGAPKEIWSDAGKNLNSKEIKSFAKVLNATKFHNSPYNHQGIAENQIRRFKKTAYGTS